MLRIKEDEKKESPAKVEKPAAQLPEKTNEAAKPPAEQPPEKTPAPPRPPPPDVPAASKPLTEQEQKQRLNEARTLVEAGELGAALDGIETVLHGSPGDSIRQEADRLAALVHERRRDEEFLRASVALLASTSRQQVREGQDRLFEKSATALPILREAVRSDNPVLVRNALETLRHLGRPDLALPIVVEVLENPKQIACWPDAIRQVELAAVPGAGERLLKLALSAPAVEQRIAALAALGKAADPPPQTILALLPMLDQDGPELAAALEAASHAVMANGQFDLVSLRGFEVPLTPQQIGQFERLGEKLAQMISRDSSPAVAKAARMLGIATHQMAAEPLDGVKVVSASGEMEGSPAAAVLDGTWDSTDTTTMWRHPGSGRAWITFDLGSARTIAGVRIWNLNERNGTHRGWREVSVLVGRTPSPIVQSVASGYVPLAPGEAKPPDYSVTLPVRFALARYVRIQMVSPWRQDNVAGLTEIQLLGF